MNFSAWRTKRFHSSYGIGWACVGLLIGLGISTVFQCMLPAFVIIILCILIIAGLIRGKWYSLILIFLCAIALGLARGTIEKNKLDSTKELVGMTTLIIGTIAEDPQVNKRGDTQLVLENIEQNGQKHSGSVWVTLRGKSNMERGDAVVIEGSIKEGFSQYPIAMSYVKVLSVTRAPDIMRDLRNSFTNSVRTYIIEPSASLGVGFVVGQRSSLPATLDEQLRIVGLTHIVVASGYNLTILVRFVRRIFEKHSKYLVAFVSSSLIGGFIIFSGLSPSMVRAGLVAGLSLAAWYYGRCFHPLLLITYVAALTAMFSPVYLWNDIGWWLSFLAFFGVLIVSPIIISSLYKDRQSPPIVQLVIETIAAQIMTLPLILMIFGQLPVLALIANVLAAPFIPIAMVLTAIAGIWGIMTSWLASFVALPGEIILSYFVAIVKTLSSPEWAQYSITISPIVMASIYVVITSLCYLMWRWRRVNLRASSIIE